MEKVHYQHFTRLYNRRRYQRVIDLEQNGYGNVKIDLFRASEGDEWCHQNLKPGSWIKVGSRFYFAYPQDLVVFKLTFG